jgi:hypothetical protein
MYVAKDVVFHRLAAAAVKFRDFLVVSVLCPGVDCGDSFVKAPELVAVGADSLFPNEVLPFLIKKEDSVDCQGLFKTRGSENGRFLLFALLV